MVILREIKTFLNVKSPTNFSVEKDKMSLTPFDLYSKLLFLSLRVPVRDSYWYLTLLQL